MSSPFLNTQAVSQDDTVASDVKSTAARVIAGGAGSLATGGDMIGCDININVGPQAAPTASTVETNLIDTNEVPPCGCDFVGREKEVEELTRSLERGGIVAISGMAGTGKTQLALKVAGILAGRFKRARFLNMLGTDENPRSTLDALQECVRSLTGPLERLPEGVDALYGRYCGILRQKPALIVLDNVANSEQVYRLIPPEECALIVTSIQKIEFIKVVACEISLGVFQPDEARALLIKTAPRITREVAEEISELCDFWPLAVWQAGSLIRKTIIIEPAEYADRLKRERDLLLKSGAGAPLSVEAAFNLSYRALGPHSQDVFRKLAVFPSDFDSHAAEDVCEDSGNNGLDNLLSLGMVNSSQAGRYSLQHLLQLFADRLLTEEERDRTTARHARYYGSVLREARELYLRGSESVLQGLALFDRERNNLRAGWLWAQSRCKEDEDAARMCVGYTVTGEPLFELRDHPHDRIAMFEAALPCAERLKDRLAECRLLSVIGSAHFDMGNVQRAVEYHNRQLAAAREMGSKAEESNALNSLGKDHRQSDTNKALDLHRQALQICQATGDNREKARTLNGLADAYFDSGVSKSAREHYEEQLEIAREIGDRRREGRALKGIGNSYNQTGRFRAAIEYYEQLLKLSREIGYHSGESAALNNIGDTYLTLGEASKARGLFEESLKIAADIGDRRSEYVALISIGEAHLALGEPRRAIELCDKALDLCRESKARRDESYALTVLGSAYADVGETPRAVEFYEQALTITRDPGSKDRHAEAHALNGLGEARSATGKTRAGIELYNQAVAIFGEIHDRRGEGMVLNNLGKAYCADGDSRRAVEFHERALTIAEDVEDQRGQGLAQNNLGRDYIALGELDRAAKHLRKALDIARAIGNRRGEANALFNMSMVLDGLGERTQAIAQAEAALEVYQLVKHPKAASVREQLSRWREEQQHNSGREAKRLTH